MCVYRVVWGDGEGVEGGQQQHRGGRQDELLLHDHQSPFLAPLSLAQGAAASSPAPLSASASELLLLLHDHELREQAERAEERVREMQTRLDVQATRHRGEVEAAMTQVSIGAEGGDDVNDRRWGRQ